jgi:tetratricopeptide (TPR) repeat protein
MLGWMYFLAGDSSQAQLHLESALQLNPELASTYYHLGVLRKALGEDEAAQFAFLRAIDLDTDGFYRSQAQKALREMSQVR